MRILLIGAGGMLARDIIKVFDRDEIIVSDLKAVGDRPTFITDITKYGEVKELLHKVRPGLLINASAYTDVDGCEDDVDLAYSVNAKGPENLAIACKEYRIKMVHISTDYIFDGNATVPYKETDFPSPAGMYGKSKLAGDIFIAKNLKERYILRTALLYGINRDNFVSKIYAKIKNNEPVTVPDDMIGSPTWTVELARMIKGIYRTHKFGTYNAVYTGIKRKKMKDSLTRARNYVYWLISKQSRTKKELLDKLKRKEYEDNVVSKVIKEAEENGLINDKRYALAYASDRMNFFKSGKNLVRMKLQQKGVEKPLIEAAIESVYKDVDEYAQALDLGKRRARSYRKLEKQVIARRLTSYIVRRGFSFDTAIKVTKTLLKDVQYEE